MRRREDPGEIQGRSVDLRSSVFRGVGGSMGEGTRKGGVGAENKVMRIRVRGGLGEDRGEGETRTMECGGVHGNLVRSDEERSEE